MYLVLLVVGVILAGLCLCAECTETFLQGHNSVASILVPRWNQEEVDDGGEGCTELLFADEDSSSRLLEGWVAEAERWRVSGRYHDAVSGILCILHSCADTIEQTIAYQMTHRTAHQLRMSLGKTLAHLGHYELAVRLFYEASVLNNTPEAHFNAHFQLGLIRAKQGFLADAIVHYKTALAHAPGDVPALHKLAGLLVVVGKTNEGLSYYTMALERYKAAQGETPPLDNDDKDDADSGDRSSNGGGEGAPVVPMAQATNEESGWADDVEDLEAQENNPTAWAISAPFVSGLAAETDASMVRVEGVVASGEHVGLRTPTTALVMARHIVETFDAMEEEKKEEEESLRASIAPVSRSTTNALIHGWLEEFLSRHNSFDAEVSFTLGLMLHKRGVVESSLSHLQHAGAPWELPLYRVRAQLHLPLVFKHRRELAVTMTSFEMCVDDLLATNNDKEEAGFEPADGLSAAEVASTAGIPTFGSGGLDPFAPTGTLRLSPGDLVRTFDAVPLLFFQGHYPEDELDEILLSASMALKSKAHGVAPPTTTEDKVTILAGSALVTIEKTPPLTSKIANMFLQLSPGLSHVSKPMSLVAERRGEAPAARVEAAGGGDGDSRPTVRVGLVSTRFRDHFVSHLLAGLMERLPRGPGGFEVVALCFPTPSDLWTRKIQGAVDGHVNLLNGDYSKTLSRAASAEADVLIFTDLMIDHRTYFLSFARLAPVQVALWPSSATTGVPSVDYMVIPEAFVPDDSGNRTPAVPEQSAAGDTEDVVSERGGGGGGGGGGRPLRAVAERFTEQLTQLAGIGSWISAPPRIVDSYFVHGGDNSSLGFQIDDADALSDALASMRREIGFRYMLGQGRHLHVAPFSVMQFHPDFDLILLHILTSDPAALVLVATRETASEMGSPEDRIWDNDILQQSHPELWRERLLRRLRARLPPSAADRVRFLPPLPASDYVALLAGAHTVLDSVPVGNALPSLYALYFGTPVITLPGSQRAGMRYVEGMYRLMERWEAAEGGARTVQGGAPARGQLCLARDVAHYAEIAQRLSHDDAFSVKLRVALADAARGALFYDQSSVDDWARFLYAAGSPFAEDRRRHRRSGGRKKHLHMKNGSPR